MPGTRFQQGDRVTIVQGERLAELGRFAYYGESGRCWVSFLDRAMLAYSANQLKHFSG